MTAKYWTWRAEIGMFCLDRSRTSCVHATSFCRKHCMWNKLEKAFPGVLGAQKRREAAWQELPCWDAPVAAMAELRRKRNQTKRVRLCSVGEPITNMEDVMRIEHLCVNLPDTKIWAPTRTWRSKHTQSMVRTVRAMNPNLILMASIDPSTSLEELDMLRREGWSMLFFGNNDWCPKIPGVRTVKCTKTWDKEKGACATCTNGCFSSGQKLVWLKEH